MVMGAGNPCEHAAPRVMHAIQSLLESNRRLRVLEDQDCAYYEASDVSRRMGCSLQSPRQNDEVGDITNAAELSTSLRDQESHHPSQIIDMDAWQVEDATAMMDMEYR